MSFRVTSLVRSRKAGSHMRKSLLAYFAERANDDGTGIWASKRRMALEIECSRGAVISNIKDLVAEGLLIEVGQRKHERGYTMEYAVNLKAVRNLPEAISDDPFKIEHVEVQDVQEDDPTGYSGEPEDVQEDDTNNQVTILESSNNTEREIFDLYNQTARKHGWITSRKLTAAHKQSISARVNDYGVEGVRQFIEALTLQDWTIKGFPDNPKFRASLDYVMRPKTFKTHFDKLVPEQPDQQPDLLSSAPEESALETLFRIYASSGDWLGQGRGYPLRPEHERADYPAELYQKYNLRKAA